jgi:cyclophilin family peptidyl-prolyl cis-trans isomerase
MTHYSLILAALAGLSCLAIAPIAAATAEDDHPVVILDTSLGAITLELDRAKAPITVDNFLKYVDAGYYNGLVFHRVIPGFMIQGGGMTEALQEKTEGQRGPIKNESGNGLSNVRGTIAMARKPDPNSATSQFFINLADNSRLDHFGGGYTVFGKVTEGMDSVDAIAKTPTARKSDYDDVPVKPISIKSTKRKAKS